MSKDGASDPDLKAVAAEALDLWQEHLAAYGASPQSKAELLNLLEPMSRLFAEWAMMMQYNAHAPGDSPFDPRNTRFAAGTGAARTASGDRTDDVPGLSRRVAELEKRIRELESGSGNKSRTTSRKHKGARGKPRAR